MVPLVAVGMANYRNVFNFHLTISHAYCFPGYGREYRERLLGKWGIVDVNDSCSCARFLVNNFYVLVDIENGVARALLKP